MKKKPEVKSDSYASYTAFSITEAGCFTFEFANNMGPSFDVTITDDNSQVIAQMLGSGKHILLPPSCCTDVSTLTLRPPPSSQYHRRRRGLFLDTPPLPLTLTVVYIHYISSFNKEPRETKYLFLTHLASLILLWSFEKKLIRVSDMQVYPDNWYRLQVDVKAVQFLVVTFEFLSGSSSTALMFVRPFYVR